MDISVLKEHLHHRPTQLRQARQQGRKVVGYLPGNYVPEEIIYAAGAIPLGLVQGGNGLAADAGLRLVPQFICPFARSLLGDRLLNHPPFDLPLDLLIVPMTCQHLKKVAEIWEYEGGVEVIKLGVPHQHAHAYETTYFADRLGDLLDRLQLLTGNEIGHDKLTSAIRLYNKLRGQLRKLSLLRRSATPPLTAAEYLFLHHASFKADPVFMVDYLSSEFKRLSSHTSSIASAGPRILLMGPHLGDGDHKISDLVAAAGGQIVVEEFCEGMRSYWYDLDETGDLIHCLVKGYLLDRVPCAFMRDSSRQRLEFALHLAREFNVAGIIWYELVCCETYDSEAYFFSREMAKHRIPFLILESDYGTADTGQLSTRIEAFIEILQGVA